MPGVGAFYIREQFTSNWVATDIDSSGMSVHFTSIINAHEFREWSDAEAFISRLSERYPARKFEIVPHH